MARTTNMENENKISDNNERDIAYRYRVEYLEAWSAIEGLKEAENSCPVEGLDIRKNRLASFGCIP